MRMVDDTSGIIPRTTFYTDFGPIFTQRLNFFSVQEARLLFTLAFHNKCMDKPKFCVSILMESGQKLIYIIVIFGRWNWEKKPICRFFGSLRILKYRLITRSLISLNDGMLFSAVISPLFWYRVHVFCFHVIFSECFGMFFVRVCCFLSFSITHSFILFFALLACFSIGCLLRSIFPILWISENAVSLVLPRLALSFSCLSCFSRCASVIFCLCLDVFSVDQWFSSPFHVFCPPQHLTCLHFLSFLFLTSHSNLIYALPLCFFSSFSPLVSFFSTAFFSSSPLWPFVK